MSNSLTRFFTRAAKRLSGRPLSLDDFSTAVAKCDPSVVTWYKAERQHNSDYWRVYQTHGFYGGFGKFDIVSGVSLKEALNELEKIEAEWEPKLRGQKGRPYNHYSAVREVLAAEEAAAQAATQPAGASVETRQSVRVTSPLTLKKPSA